MLNLVANGSSGYNLNNSLRFRASATAYLNRTPASTTNRQIFTLSAWVKRGSLSTRQIIFCSANPTINTVSQQEFQIAFDSSDKIQMVGGVSGVSLDFEIVTTQVFRDPSAWYHIVVAVDTTQATAANRMKLYVNGSQVTSFSTTTNPAQNYNTAVNLIVFSHRFGGSGTNYLDGYLTEINFVDGQQLVVTSFGSTDAVTGSWIPKKYSGTYGTNGFYLPFTDNSALTTTTNVGLGRDYSSNGNFFATNNISITAGTTYDSMTDVPTNTSATAGNYCTPNPLDMFSTTVMSNGNLTVNVSGSSSGAGAGGTARCNTINFTGLSGKWYWEAFVDNAGTGAATLRTTFGMIAEPARCSNNPTGAAWTWRADGVNTGLTAASTFATNDVVMFAYDSATGKLWLGKNGTWTNSGVPASGTGNNATLTALAEYALFLNYGTSGGGTGTASFNYGQRPFSYSAPTGFVRLNTFNLPDSTIKKGNTVMDASLWTGNGASNRTITNSGSFRPDLVWTKGRNTASWNHFLNDSVRGFPNFLISSSTAAEGTTSPSIVSASASNGFVIQANGNSNNNGDTYVGWQWQAGQGSSSSNTSGSITSTVSVNTTAGFSVVTYTGTGASATVGHGLGVAPKFIIVKTRSATNPWVVYTASLGVQYYTLLNATDASYNNLANYWSATAPSSTVFGLNSYGGNNTNAATYIAYCWADVSGFSKAFSYTGNGSADGSFVYTGFLPRFVLIKRTDTTGDWYMWDTARNTYDVITNTLLANSSAAETSATSIDALSNGFKLRNTTAGFNASGGTYIGMAWATNPFKNSNAF